MTRGRKPCSPAIFSPAILACIGPLFCDRTNREQRFCPLSARRPGMRPASVCARMTEKDGQRNLRKCQNEPKISLGRSSCRKIVKTNPTASCKSRRWTAAELPKRTQPKRQGARTAGKLPKRTQPNAGWPIRLQAPLLIIDIINSEASRSGESAAWLQLRWAMRKVSGAEYRALRSLCSPSTR